MIILGMGNLGDLDREFSGGVHILPPYTKCIWMQVGTLEQQMPFIRTFPLLNVMIRNTF